MREKIIAHHINGDFEAGFKGFSADQFIPSIDGRLLGGSLKVKQIFFALGSVLKESGPGGATDYALSRNAF